MNGKKLIFVGMLLVAGNIKADLVSVSDKNILNGLSPYNWVCKSNYVSSAICGASLTVSFQGTKQVSIQVDTEHINKATAAAKRYPIIAWSVNGGTFQSHQLAADEKDILLASNTANPAISLYIKGMSPFEDRFNGDAPGTALKITGFSVDKGGATKAATLPAGIWLNIGDSIMSGDCAAYTASQGRPANDLWAESDDGQASYGYLLAKHYGYRESRIATGGYNWGGGLGNLPDLATLIDQRTSTIKRIDGEKLKPAPDVVLVNLGENGVPADAAVIASLRKIRSRTGQKTRIILMIPISGKGRAEITRAFNSYVDSDKDRDIHLVDLGQVKFETADGQHPTAAGHEVVFKAALQFIDPMIKSKGYRK
ncbi:MAG: hypothetical protein NTW21_37340 [Verrucomicrobia bacterium]|nr:hypothetical protein [Verrucomicrobiota bacterium]